MGMVKMKAEADGDSANEGYNGGGDEAALLGI